MTAQHEGRIGIRVYGTPIPQGSKVANRFGNGVRDANAARLKPWREQVRAHAADTFRYHDTITDPVRVWLRFTFDRPPSHYRTGRNAHLLKDASPTMPTLDKVGDLDKLVRAILDALTDAEVWTDDRLVVDVRARKFYASEDDLALDRAGVDIIVEPLAPPATALVSEGEAGASAVHTQQGTTQGPDTGCVLAEHDGSQLCPDGCWNGSTCIAADPGRWGADPTGQVAG